MNTPNSKRRRLVDAWSSPKGYDDKPPTSVQLCNSNNNTNDPMEDLGIQHWLHSNTFPIEIRPLSTSCCFGRWCYYPNSKNMNAHSHTWQQFKAYGVAGVHYAVGYKQLGEMIIKYGSDYSNWPRLSLSLPQDDSYTGSFALELQQRTTLYYDYS